MHRFFLHIMTLIQNSILIFHSAWFLFFQHKILFYLTQRRRILSKYSVHKFSLVAWLQIQYTLGCPKLYQKRLKCYNIKTFYVKSIFKNVIFSTYMCKLDSQIAGILQKIFFKVLSYHAFWQKIFFSDFFLILSLTFFPPWIKEKQDLGFSYI